MSSMHSNGKKSAKLVKMLLTFSYLLKVGETFHFALHTRQEICECLTHRHGSLSHNSVYLHFKRDISKWQAFSKNNENVNAVYRNN